MIIGLGYAPMGNRTWGHLGIWCHTGIGVVHVYLKQCELLECPVLEL